MVKELNREPTIQEIAEKMNLPADEIIKIVEGDIENFYLEPSVEDIASIKEVDIKKIKKMIDFVPASKKKITKSPIKKLTERELEKKVESLMIKKSKEEILGDEIPKKPVYLERNIVLRSVTKSSSSRNLFVAELTKRRTKGFCQLCQNPAPFEDNDGKPYLETHHIEWLSQGGEDTIDNTVALCPNCHRKMHVLNLESDINRLKARTNLKVNK